MKKIFLVFLFIFLTFNTDVFAKDISIVQFSDVHLDTVRPDDKVRKFKQSVPMLQKAIKKVNSLNPDAVIFSGDMVNRPSESDFDVFLNNAKKLNMKFYPVPGNHDVGINGGLSKRAIVNKLNENCNWLKLDKTFYYEIIGEYIFIFMDGTTDKKITSQGYFPKETFDFLEITLNANKNKKAIIVQHFPLITPYRSTSHDVINKEEYMSIIDKHPNIIMVLSGHFHASITKVRENVVFITTPSLIEYPHAFRFLTIHPDKKEILITSKLYMDEEQNAVEESNLVYNKLKLGKDEYNNFSITINNPIEENIIEEIFDKVGELFNKAKRICYCIIHSCENKANAKTTL